LATRSNIFEGGFLGLDNIGVFDRSRPLPTGGYIEQSDGTAWMAMFCLNMLRISIELSQRDPVYEDMTIKFLEHFLYIAQAMTDMATRASGSGMTKTISFTMCSPCPLDAKSRCACAPWSGSYRCSPSESSSRT
jgi:hypothetical protein